MNTLYVKPKDVDIELKVNDIVDKIIMFLREDIEAPVVRVNGKRWVQIAVPHEQVLPYGQMHCSLKHLMNPDLFIITRVR